jgi:hypothetical protein
MVDDASKHVLSTVRTLVLSGAATATTFVSPTLTVRATRKRFKGKVPKRGNVEVILTIGKPNHEARAFIRTAKQAGEPFPIKKIRLTGLPKA